MIEPETEGVSTTAAITGKGKERRTIRQAILNKWSVHFSKVIANELQHYQQTTETRMKQTYQFVDSTPYKTKRRDKETQQQTTETLMN